MKVISCRSQWRDGPDLEIGSFWLCGAQLVLNTRRLRFVSCKTALATIVLIRLNLLHWGCRCCTFALAVLLFPMKTTAAVQGRLYYRWWRMDQVKKTMLVCSSEFYNNVVLLLIDINRPEVSPRWLWTNRWWVQWGSCMTSHVGLVLPDCKGAA